MFAWPTASRTSARDLLPAIREGVVPHHARRALAGVVNCLGPANLRVVIQSDVSYRPTFFKWHGM